MKTFFCFTASVLLTAAFFGCSEPSGQGGDTQTNWLKSCTADSECGALSCHCGVCTRSCSAGADCDGAPAGVSCRAASSVETMAQCGAEPAESLCLPPNLTPASTVESFCEDYVGALCEHLADCDCSEQAQANCASAVEECAGDGGFFAMVRARVAAGGLEFDSAAATALIARLSNPSTSCADQIIAAGFDSYTARSFGGVFEGTLPAGSPCETPEGKKNVSASECQPGLICLTGADTTSTCVPLAGPGEPCPVLSNDAGSSCLERKAPDKDGEFESAFAGLTCVPSEPGSQEGTCRTAAPDGSPCDDGRQCESGRCAFEANAAVGSCGPKLENGSDCELSSQCESGRCVTTCETRLPDGSACSSNDDCLSAGCNRPDGAASGTCGAPMAPVALPKGSACVEHEECGPAQVCDMGFCGERLCQDFSS